MKILAVIQALDFQNYPRRATLEAIFAECEGAHALSYTHARNRFRTRTGPSGGRIRYAYYVLPMGLREKAPVLAQWHTFCASLRWRRFFDQHDVILFTYPLQAPLLPLCRKEVAFVLSDPFHLRSARSLKSYEARMLERADHIFSVSGTLKETYLPKYFPQVGLDRVHIWPNTVDLKVWDSNKYGAPVTDRVSPVVGFAGHFYEGNDLELLDRVTDQFLAYRFQLAGRNHLVSAEKRRLLRRILAKPNVEHLAFVPFNDLPALVAQWDVCLMLDGQNELGSYMHPNKIYQYLAMGKPAIVLRTNNEFDSYADAIFLSRNHDEYLDNLNVAVGMKDDLEGTARRLEIARSCSSKVRAREFMAALNSA